MFILLQLNPAPLELLSYEDLTEEIQLEIQQKEDLLAGLPFPDGIDMRT